MGYRGETRFPFNSTPPLLALQRSTVLTTAMQHGEKGEPNKYDPQGGHSLVMAPSRTLRRAAVVFLVVSFLYITGDRIFQLLSIPTYVQQDNSATSDSNSPSWELFYHLGGNGPWIPRRSELGSIQDSLPQDCFVDQVHLMSRHGERYPTKSAGSRHLQLLDRLHQDSSKLTGSLSFLKAWTYFTDPHAPAFEKLTDDGPFAGTKQARDSGQKLFELYGHLVHHGHRTRFWSCSSPRDIETGRYFATGFFGEDWEKKGLAELQIIPEEAERGGDTLTPGDTCLKYIEDPEEGHDKGYGKLATWQTNFSAPISNRLLHDVGGLSLSPVDIFSMMEMCGFEILARGSSPWCDVFTHDEWAQFEYARDLLHFYRAGPGNRFSKPMGWLYLNATADILMNTSSNDVYFSFVHDGDIVPLLSSLQILDENGDQELPTDGIKANRRWVTSDVVPMGGRVIFERIACGALRSTSRHYVRISINNGIVTIPNIPTSNEVPYAIKATDFWDFVNSKRAEYGDFAEVCGLPPGAPARISFLHQ